MSDEATTTYSPPPLKGWICPVCGAGCAPWVTFCGRCAPNWPPYPPFMPPIIYPPSNNPPGTGDPPPSHGPIITCGPVKEKEK